MSTESVQVSPLARAYLAAVRSGQVSKDSPERQLMDGAAYILRYGVDGCTADVLRVVAALCEAVATLKEEPCGDLTKSLATPASPAKSALTN